MRNTADGKQGRDCKVDAKCGDATQCAPKPVISDITPVLIVKDGGLTITKCLQSLTRFDEIVVFLNNTTDNTREICAEFPNVKLIEGAFTNYSETRNKAASYASNDWIYYMDADEQLEDKLVDSIAQFNLSDKDAVGLNLIQEYFMGKQIKRGWLRPHWRPSIYNRNSRSFSKTIYESIDLTGAKLIKLEGNKNHYGTQEIPAFLIKGKRYGELHAHEGKKRRPLSIAILGALYSFMRSLFFQGGIIDGKAGIYSAYVCAMFHFYRYTMPKPRQ